MSIEEQVREIGTYLGCNEDELWSEMSKLIAGSWEQNLLLAVQGCRQQNEGMRFGQLIFNALATHDTRSADYDENFHSRLFNVYDEELETALREWFEWVEQQRSKKDSSS